jgi:phosphohistidine phosphatase SixA
MSSRSVRRVIARWLGVFAIASACIGVTHPALGQSTQSRHQTPPLAGAALVDALRRGGYILYFRHTSTDFGQNDDRMTGYEDCARQRNLTETGRTEARAIGAAIRALDLPVGRVLASPFCRTRETAQLIFGRATVSNAARGGAAQADDDRYAELKTLLSTPVPAGVDLAIVSHGNPYRAIVGGRYLAEGEAAVIEPRGKEAFRVVAQIRKDEWPALSAAK